MADRMISEELVDFIFDTENMCATDGERKGLAVAFDKGFEAGGMKLRAAIRDFIAIQDMMIDVFGLQLPGDWKKAYDAMKELMGQQAEPK